MEVADLAEVVEQVVARVDQHLGSREVAGPQQLDLAGQLAEAVRVDPLVQEDAHYATTGTGSASSARSASAAARSPERTAPSM